MFIKGSTILKELESKILKGQMKSLPDVMIDTPSLEKAIAQKRSDVIVWLMREKLLYISDKYNNLKCIFIKKKDTKGINYRHIDLFRYLHSRHSIICKHLSYAYVHNAIMEPSVLDWLLQHGANINRRNQTGQTLFHSAIEKKLYTTFYLLFEFAPNVNAQDHFGNTPLHYAVSQSNEMAIWLIRYGCNVDVKNNKGETPLYLAASYNCEKAVRMLLRHNANPAICDNQGKTPFMCSLEHARCLMAQKMLLKCVYDINVATNWGETALSIAMRKSNPLALEIVRRGGNVCPTYYIETLHLALNYSDTALFKLVFSKCDATQFTLEFGNRYLKNRTFSTKDWVHYLFLLFNSKFGDNLKWLLKNQQISFFDGFLTTLLKEFDFRCVKKQYRVRILEILVKKNVCFEGRDFDLLYELYGFNNEFELGLKMIRNYHLWESPYRNIMVKLIVHFESFVDGQWKFLLSNYFNEEFKNRDNCAKSGDEIGMIDCQKKIVAAAKFFSLRYYVVNIRLGENIRKLINKMSMVPSLQELSRNKVRGLIGLFRGKHPVYFQENLKRLPIPQVIEDIIRLKRPIYS